MDATCTEVGIYYACDAVTDAPPIYTAPCMPHTHPRPASVTAWRFMRRPGRNPKHTCGVFSHACGTGADLSSVMKYFLCVCLRPSLSLLQKGQRKVKESATRGPERRPTFPIAGRQFHDAETAARVAGSLTRGRSAKLPAGCDVNAFEL